MTDDCTRCGMIKSVEEFCRSKQAKRGYIRICKACERVRTRARRKGTPETARLHQLRSKYGITKEVYDSLVVGQGDRCRICQKSCALRVDHCHTTGVVRGLLCHGCNVGIGFLRDDPALLREAAAYIERSRLPTTIESNTASIEVLRADVRLPVPE